MPTPIMSEDFQRSLQKLQQSLPSSSLPTPLSASHCQRWPQMAAAAYHGIAGEVVGLLEPHTEADPVALLVSLLAECGTMLGRAPHIIVDGTYHPLLCWAVLVGQSSKSRKGTAGKRIKQILDMAEPEWQRGDCKGTLSSGEGLVWAIRDPQYRDEPIKDKGKPTGEMQSVCIDLGVEDKRLFLQQSEFGALLRIMNRDGNSLSGVLRDAWDGQDLAPMTKANRVRASSPHIGIVGHVTQDELLLNLSSTEASNGFGNRFEWFLVKRSKELPFPSSPSTEAMEAIARRLRRAIQQGRTVNAIDMTEKAKITWGAMYSELSADRPGLAGSLLGRAEANVMRRAALYAILDCQAQIDHDHLVASLAVFNYCEESVKTIFGNMTGDPIADKILQAVRNSDGLTDTEISNLFKRHVPSNKLDRAKDSLCSYHLIACEDRGSLGRPARFWYSTAKKAKEAN